MQELLAAINQAQTKLRPPSGRFVIGIAGSVAVGKSTLARQLAEQLPGTCISTDRFLLSNEQLAAQGIEERKGHPESFDIPALQQFLGDLRTQNEITGLHRYSHATFDVEPDPIPFRPTNFVIVEGINVLQPQFTDLLDYRIFLTAPEETIVTWYTQRFVHLTDLARSTGSGFYLRFAQQNAEELNKTARYVWDLINAPNLHRHIEPTRHNADIIVHKRTDHSFEIRNTDVR